jgi:hypothetical protein
MELDKLFAERTHWLRDLVRKRSPGRPPTFDRRKVDRRIALLREYAEKAIVKTEYKRDFSTLYDRRQSWHPRAGGRRSIEAKRKAFRKFWRTRIGGKRFVYIFWRDGDCIYVGRTRESGQRPQAHFKKPWFRSVSRIDLYVTNHVSGLPKLECLAVHWFQPARNKARPARRKWSKKCSIRKARRRDDLKSIFKLR